MLVQDHGCIEQCEEALARALLPVATELRAIDVADLIAFVRLEKYGCLNSLLSSAAEIHFKAGTIVLAKSSEVKVLWSRMPEIHLGMIFHSNVLSTYFRLVLSERKAGVEIDYIDCPSIGLQSKEFHKKFEAELYEAQMKPTRDYYQ